MQDDILAHARQPMLVDACAKLDPRAELDFRPRPLGMDEAMRTAYARLIERHSKLLAVCHEQEETIQFLRGKWWRRLARLCAGIWTLVVLVWMHGVYS